MKKSHVFAIILSLVYALSLTGCGKSYEEMVEEAAKLTPEEQAVRDDTEKMLKDYEEWKVKRDAALNNVDEEFDYYQELWEELESISDEDGHIKAEDMERAEYIVDTLNEGLDMNIVITDGYVENFDD